MIVDPTMRKEFRRIDVGYAELTAMRALAEAASRRRSGFLTRMLRRETPNARALAAEREVRRLEARIEAMRTDYLGKYGHPA